MVWMCGSLCSLENVGHCPVYASSTESCKSVFVFALVIIIVKGKFKASFRDK